MNHWAAKGFWRRYLALPESTRRAADAVFELLKKDPRHPSLRLKKVGAYWSARVGLRHRALAVEVDGGLLWIWIGTHAEYDAFLSQ